MQNPTVWHSPGGSLLTGAFALIRRLWATLRVRAARMKARHSGPLGLLLWAVCLVGTGLLKGWMTALALVGRLERRCHSGLRRTVAGIRRGCTECIEWLEELRPRNLWQAAAPLVLCALVALGLYQCRDLTLALSVEMDGEHLGYVRTKDDLNTVLGSVEQLATHHLGSPYQMQGTFAYQLKLIHEQDLMNTAATTELLLSRIDGIVTEYALTVNGALMGANRSRMGLTLLKERLLEERTSEENIHQSQFVQNIRVEQAAVSSADVLELADIRTKLTANRTEAGFYTVAAGDTVSAISLRHGLTLAQVKELNPGLDVDKIGIGDKILVALATPMLTVEEIRVESYTEAVPFEELEVGNANLYVIDSRITQKGVKGQAEVTARVVYHNGVEARREILTYTVTQEPVPQIKEVGTQALPAWWPTGTFAHPCPDYVYISSNFGYRKSFGDNHTGIDLAANTGTAILASDGGTVTVAGYSGNYGYVVYIDHGNGYVTRYAHCSKLLVKVGQKVAQGEKIALVGSTGKSTGPHCHFEIRYKGVAKNPKDYLKF